MACCYSNLFNRLSGRVGRVIYYQVGDHLYARAAPGDKFVFLLAFVGFGTKAAVFPMYAWLPAASVAPTPVTALLDRKSVV